MDSETPRAATAAEGVATFSPPALLQDELAKVRTRKNLADLINSASDPVLIKQEEVENEMEVDDISEVELVGEFDGDQHSVYYEGEEGGDDDENLLDEQDGDDEEGGEDGSDDGTEDGSCDEGGDSGAEGREDSAVGTALAAGTAQVHGLLNPANEEGEAAAGTAPPEHEDRVAEGREGQEMGGKEDEQSGDSWESEDDPGEAEIIDPVNPNLRLDQRFFAVRSMLSGSMEPRLLNCKMKRPEPGPGFLVEGDERWYRNANSSCTSKKINSSASFKPSGKCHTCLSGEHEAWIGKLGQPVVIVAADQHFPANLPTDGDGDCIRIIRVENGSLAEITKELTSLVPRECLLPGTVIMLGAPQQLAVVSVEFYAGEWKKARNYLKADLGDVIVLPLILLSAMGFQDTRIIRGMIDMAAWLEDMEEHELRLLRNTRKSFEDVYLSKTDRGAGWADQPVNMALPVSLCGQSTGTPAYVSGNWGARPTEIIAADGLRREILD
jgi:hypothetical protein